jgi:hypothetical protein
MSIIENQRYVVITAEDGHHWVVLEPLLADLKEAIDNSIENMEIAEKLMTAHSFIESLLMEGRTRDWELAQARKSSVKVNRPRK